MLFGLDNLALVGLAKSSLDNDMHRSNLILVATLLLFACGDGDVPTDSSRQQAEQISEEQERIFLPSPAQTACRFRVEAQFEPMVLFDYTVSQGGRTCYSDGGIDIFIPAENDVCRLPSWSQGAEVATMDVNEAERQFMSCTAIFSEPGRTSTGVIILSPKSTSFDMNDIDILHRDIQALISNDGLAVTYEGRLSQYICLEASEPDSVVSHILGADMVPTDEIGHRVAWGTCLEIGSRVSGIRWPEFVRDEPER